MFKKFTCSLVILSLIGGITAVNAQPDPLKISMNDEDIVIDGKNVELFETFDNNDLALKAIQENYSNLLDELMNNHSLASLSSENIEDYKSICASELNNDLANAEIKGLYHYLDTYILRSENDAIKELSSQYSKTHDKELLLQIDLRSPHTSEKVYEKASLMDWRPFDVQTAVIYATAFATTNPPGFPRYTDDNAPFASQIVNAGGIPIYNNGDVQTGWYPGSKSWTETHRFANWYGIWNKSKSHDWFSYNVSVGDFVAVDWDSNGTWDRIGFVTGKAQNEEEHIGSLGIKYRYKDYRIAQHTADFNQWTSRRGTWIDYGWSANPTYGIVLTPH